MQRFFWLLTVFILSHCGKFATRPMSGIPDDGSASRELGCIQGRVVNGLTGETLPLATNDERNFVGIHALVRNNIISAKPIGQEFEGTGAKMIGSSYLICNIPLNEEIPVFVNVPGFQPFEGAVEIASHVRFVDENIARTVPTELRNIALFPIGTETKDLKIVVSHRGVPQPDAQVLLLSTSGNTLTPSDNHYMQPPGRLLLSESISGKTNDKGETVFPANILVLGARYMYRVLPPNGGVDRSFAEGFVTLGLLSGIAKNDQQPYLVFVDLDNPLPNLALVSSSILARADSANAEGAIDLYFNREFEVVPGTIDQITAELSDQNGAVLKTDILDNDTPDRVKLTILPEQNNRLRLTPIWSVEPDAAREPGLKITYKGIKLRPKGAPGTATSLSLDDLGFKLQVAFYGGVYVPQMARAAVNPEPSCNNQRAPALTDLPKPIVFKVIDKFDQGMKTPQPITFKIVSGGGSVRGVDNKPLPTHTADGTGLASVIWRLGSEFGEQVLEVSSGNLAPVRYVAFATQTPNNIAITRGANLSVPAGKDVAEPLEVQVTNQFDRPLQGESVPVIFEIVEGIDSTIRLPSETDGKRSLIAQTDGTTGRAQIKMRLGATGRHVVAATMKTGSGTKRVEFVINGTQVVDKIVVLSGNNQEATVETLLSQPSMVKLLDQFAKPFATPVKLIFRVVEGGGMVRPLNGGSEYSEIQVVTTSDGMAGAQWRLGKTVGAQKLMVLTVDALGIAPISFTANATAKPAEPAEPPKP